MVELSQIRSDEMLLADDSVQFHSAARLRGESEKPA
jgi:hypothetical protein